MVNHAVVRPVVLVQCRRANVLVRVWHELWQEFWQGEAKPVHYRSV